MMDAQDFKRKCMFTVQAMQPLYCCAYGGMQSHSISLMMMTKDHKTSIRLTGGGMVAESLICTSLEQMLFPHPISSSVRWLLNFQNGMVLLFYPF